MMALPRLFDARRAQVLVLVLWLLAILTVLALSLARQVLTSARMMDFAREGFEAELICQTGLFRAVEEIRRDPVWEVDTLQDFWADQPQTFDNITVADQPQARAVVGYKRAEGADEPAMVFGCQDQESLINLNTASQQLLIVLFEECHVRDPQYTTRCLLIWRGDLADEAKIYERLGYSAKKGSLSCLEELVLVDGIASEDLRVLEPFATVHGAGQVNVNTASEKIMEILAVAAARQAGFSDSFGRSVSRKILDLRRKKDYFTSWTQIDPAWTGSEEQQVFERIKPQLVFSSDHFLICSEGTFRQTRKSVRAVYRRSENQFLQWYES